MSTSNAAFEIRDELYETTLLLEVLKQSFEREGFEAQYLMASMIKDRLEKALANLSSNR